MQVKNRGQVITPKNIIKDILELSDYKGEKILKKHVMENSCANGAFLVEIVKRYINAYKRKNKTLKGIEEELSTYIHGIEIDKELHKECIKELNNLAKEQKIGEVNWDIINGNSLKIDKYNNEMDYVIGNPPYVRTHNLEDQYQNVKNSIFCTNGMIDLYIIFFEVGLKMLKNSGTLCYITPNSFYTSVAGTELRNYIKTEQCLETIMDLGHYQPFKETTYTTITKIQKGSKFNHCKYYKYSQERERPIYKNIINYNKLFIDGRIYLETNKKGSTEVLQYNSEKLETRVKNGFATLSDKIFIQNDFPFVENTIDVIKSSTGKWAKCIYPYDENGKIIPFEELNEDVQKYLLKNKEKLEKRSIDKNTPWYAFGRTQAINDVQKQKISINTTIKDIESIKLNLIEPGQGVYSGLYILTDKPYEYIEKIIKTKRFIKYIEGLNKCKNAGYYTFSSKDLEKYINYHTEVMNMDNNKFLNIIRESFEKYLETSSRSNEKLKILHGEIAKDLADRLGDGYKVNSLNTKGGKEKNIQGEYMVKKVDITISKKEKDIAGIALKFIMSNYWQNSNNYFENMLGETANIRRAGKTYYQILVLPSKLPYFNKSGEIKKYEEINQDRLEKYIKLSKEDIKQNLYCPNKMLIYIVDIPIPGEDCKQRKDYIEFYQNLAQFHITKNNEEYEFGDMVVYNDYERFISEICDEVENN